ARTPTRGSGAVAHHHYRGRMQDPSPHGPLNATVPYIEDHAPASTTPTAGAGTATGAIFTGPRTISRMMQRPPPSHSVLPTVSDHCTPAIQGKTTTSTPPLMCTAPPYNYKRRRRASFSRALVFLSL